MKTTNTRHTAPTSEPNSIELRIDAWGNVQDSFEKFCLARGIEVLQGMMGVLRNSKTYASHENESATSLNNLSQFLVK